MLLHIYSIQPNTIILLQFYSITALFHYSPIPFQ
ncbi:hypothetical protein F383_36771 [Gossypium arboreum]|uniref:Uncharacterized protein n=1 Tax=Gossypium arboreum TaxID=29729 RepID=A0A0B0M9Y4_GOSAR|nr:hypothetical protein F383_36771 [Gossypium arboreum]